MGFDFRHDHTEKLICLLERFVTAYEKSVDQSATIRDLTAKLKEHTDKLNQSVQT